LNRPRDAGQIRRQYRAALGSFMNNPESTHAPLKLPAVIAVALLLAVGVGLRLAGMGSEGLWLDEIYGATYTNLSLLQTVVASFRFDVHPPLYYLQLTAWSSLGHGDVWLLMNSVLWSTATLVAVFLATMRRFGVTAGLIALAFCAVLGSEVYFGAELRMYSLFGLLMVLSWLAADRLRADYRFKAALPLVVVLILIGAVHSFGMIAVAAVLLYVFPSGDRSRVKAQLPTWIATACVVGITLLPWVVNATLRKVGHLEPMTLSGVTYTISGWVLGYRAPVIPDWVQTALTLAVALCLAAAMLWIPQMRRIITCYIVLPMALAGAVSVVWKPVWLARSFAFCAPFLAVALGTLLARLLAARPAVPAGDVTAPRWGRHRYRGSSAAAPVPAGVRFVCASLMAAALIATGWFSFHEQITPWRTQYREAAAYLREHVQAGDIVYMPEYTTFWAMSRYLVGPRWGDPLEVQDPVNQDRSEIWPRIYQRLGPERLELLHLKPRTRRVDGFKVPLFIGWSALPEVSSAKSVWIAAGPELLLGDLELCSHDAPPTAQFVRLRIYRINCLTAW
jgi:mannosyltransferase